MHKDKSSLLLSLPMIQTEFVINLKEVLDFIKEQILFSLI
jgi:hypothetical protein